MSLKIRHCSENFDLRRISQHVRCLLENVGGRVQQFDEAPPQDHSPRLYGSFCEVNTLLVTGWRRSRNSVVCQTHVKLLHPGSRKRVDFRAAGTKELLARPCKTASPVTSTRHHCFPRQIITMCTRQIQTVVYFSCTATPKHKHQKIVMSPCATRCGNWKDSHMGQSTNRIAICTKC